MQDYTEGEEPHADAGKECEEEGVAETRCEELTTTPFPCPPVLLGGEEVEKSGVELSLGRREWWGSCF